MQQIEIFRAVMLAGSINQAAQQLALSQPSLSRTLRRIEDLVGFTLFDRTGNKLTPTLEARALLSSVEHVRNQLEGLHDAIDRIRTRGRGLFRFGASPSLARNLVPAALVGFRKRFPESLIHVDTLSLSDVVDYLALGRGECFLSIVPIEHKAIELRPLWPGRLVCLLPAGHRLAKRQRIEVSALEGEALILGDAETHYGTMVREVLQSGGCIPTVSMIVRVAETAIGMVAHNLGSAILDEFTAMGAASARVTVRPLDVLPSLQIYLIRSKGQASSRYVQTLEEGLLVALRELKAARPAADPSG
jgi:DNA-binding transcriptional LysR family regulator